jgi:hypothetical protein
MPVGRTVRHWTINANLVHRLDAGMHVQWRHIGLALLTLAAAAFVSYSLIVDPPPGPAPVTSYLPSAPPV